MVYKVINKDWAKELFGNWQESIILSCVQGVMGEVYGDDSTKPNSVMAVLGDFCFFAGKVNFELIKYLGEKKFIIMVPENEVWAKAIKECYGNNAKAVTRYAIKKEGNIFDYEKLESSVRSIPSKFQIESINNEIYNMCLDNEWSKDLVSNYGSYEKFKELGIGVAILYKGEIVSGASAYSRYKEGIEIEIDTKREYRRMGLAYGCGAKLILECIKRNLYPSWDAQNKFSLALAEKLGYHFDFEYVAFEVSKLINF